MLSDEIIAGNSMSGFITENWIAIQEMSGELYKPILAFFPVLGQQNWGLIYKISYDLS